MVCETRAIIDDHSLTSVCKGGRRQRLVRCLAKLSTNSVDHPRKLLPGHDSTEPSPPTLNAAHRRSVRNSQAPIENFSIREVCDGDAGLQRSFCRRSPARACICNSFVSATCVSCRGDGANRHRSRTRSQPTPRVGDASGDMGARESIRSGRQSTTQRSRTRNIHRSRRGRRTGASRI